MKSFLVNLKKEILDDIQKRIKSEEDLRASHALQLSFDVSAGRKSDVNKAYFQESNAKVALLKEIFNSLCITLGHIQDQYITPDLFTILFGNYTHLINNQVNRVEWSEGEDGLTVFQPKSGVVKTTPPLEVILKERNSS